MQPSAFDHKQFRVKEESQSLLIRSLNEYVFKNNPLFNKESKNKKNLTLPNNLLFSRIKIIVDLFVYLLL